MPTRAGKIFFRLGVYVITTPLNIYGHTVLEGKTIGHGNTVGVTLRAANGLNDNVIQYGPFGTTAYFASLHHLCINGNKNNNTSGHCFKAVDNSTNHPNDFEAEHVFFLKGAQDGVNCEYGHGYRFTDCLFEASGRHGIQILNGDETFLDNCYTAVNGASGGAIDCTQISGNINASENTIYGLRFERTNTPGSGHLLNIIAEDNGDTGVYGNPFSSTLLVQTQGNGGYGIDLQTGRT